MLRDIGARKKYPANTHGEKGEKSFFARGIVYPGERSSL
jgi:hypothetical protein